MRAETRAPRWVCNLHSVGTIGLAVEEENANQPSIFIYTREIENLTKFSITSGENDDSSKRTGVG